MRRLGSCRSIANTLLPLTTTANPASKHLSSFVLRSTVVFSYSRRSFPPFPRQSANPLLISRSFADASSSSSPFAQTKKPITSQPSPQNYPKEKIEQFVYQGQSLITPQIEKLPLSDVIVILCKNQKYAQRDEQRILEGWRKAMEQLRTIRGVNTLGEFLTMNRVAWWRAEVPQALRRLLNQAMYHKRWPTYVIDDLAKFAETKGIK
jgi:hypothetical protein